jgi:uncharacterized protein YndB with AHSA1/START domain
MVVATPTQTLTFTRTINAPASEVYRAFTDRDGLNSWLTSFAYTTLRENGEILLHWSQERYHVFGLFKEVEENKKVVFTWRGLGESADSTVTVLLGEQDGKTNMTLTHADFPDGADLEIYEREWMRRLENLVVALETGADKRITDRVIIGIIPGQISEERAKELGIEQNQGTCIVSVLANFSAAQAGLQAEDVIVEVGGQQLNQDVNIFTVTSQHKMGDEVEVGYYRGTEKHTARLKLLGYPVPELPKDFPALARRYAERNTDLMRRFLAEFEGYTDEEAAQKPAEGEWSANEVVAHLILTERWNQMWIGTHLESHRVDGWAGNSDARIASITQSYPTKDAILNEMQRTWQETVYLLESISDEFLKRPSNLWGISFNLSQDVWHVEQHLVQIRNALKAARG